MSCLPELRKHFTKKSNIAVKSIQGGRQKARYIYILVVLYDVYIYSTIRVVSDSRCKILANYIAKGGQFTIQT